MRSACRSRDEGPSTPVIDTARAHPRWGTRLRPEVCRDGNKRGALDRKKHQERNSAHPEKNQPKKAGWFTCLHPRGGCNPIGSIADPHEEDPGE
jgi:hypothetical protein